MSEKRVILPTDIKPVKYNLTMEPDLTKFTFSGSESIEFKVNKPTKRVVMNAKELEVTKCTVDIKGKKLTASKISYDEEKEYVIFDFDEEIAEDGTLYCEFTGILNDKLVGFYRAKYVVNDETRYAAATQFESTYARRAFPCFDEPAVKAVFEVTLIGPKDRVILSNMNEVSSEISGDKKIVKFAPSPIMSTYLLAFVIGEFDYVETHTESGLRIRVYTPLGKKDQGTFGLDVCKKVIPLFESYFGEKFPLPKLDLVAISDFGAGAMENWGLITYRETALLVDAKNSSARTKQRVALVVAHECAHMWFGNLVTMGWWEDLWLNEGFATWVEYLAVDQLFPDWNIFEQFVDNEFASAQRLDALISSHPIEVEVNVASEIDEIFDAISYSKGCAVIRMLAEYLGLETFKQGLRIYLQRHKYGNATTKDLWKALGEASGKDVATLMHGWTRSTGYPLLRITEEEKNTFTIEQERFFSSGPRHDETIWQIPLGYITDKNSKPVYVLLKDKKSTIKIEGDFKWIKFNPDQIGFYRVSYPEKHYPELAKAIESQALSSIDRLGLQNDISALAIAGYIGTDKALEILSGYKTETEYTVWCGVSTNVASIWKVVQFEEYADKFKKWARELFKPIMKKLGWETKPGEDHLTTLLRSQIIANLGKYDDEETIKMVKEKFDAFIKDHSVITPDLRAQFYQIAVKNGGKKEYDEIMKIYKTTDLNEEKVRCLSSLGATRDEELLKKTLEFSMKDVRKQDAIYVFQTVAANPKGRDLAWDYFKKNIKAYQEAFEDSMLLGYFIKSVTSTFCSEQLAKEAEQFFQENAQYIHKAKRSAEQSIEAIRINAAWIDRDRKVIGEWLERNVV